MAKDEGFGLAASQTVILAVLETQPRHAYDIAKEITRLSDEKIPIHFGTLYPALYRMERDGLISSVVEQPSGERQRRTYQLTERGRGEAVKARQSWNEYSAAMDKIVNRTEPSVEG